MNAAGRILGYGKLPGWTSTIRPYRDRPDVEVRWVWYAVPHTNPPGPETWLTPRFWDEREHWYPLTVGVVPGTTRPFFGPLPLGDVGPLVGSADEWANGLLFSAPAPAAPCWPVGPGEVQTPWYATRSYVLDGWCHGD